MADKAANLYSGKSPATSGPAPSGPAPAYTPQPMDAPESERVSGSRPSAAAGSFTRVGASAPAAVFGRPKRGFDTRLLPNVDVTLGLANLSGEVEVVPEASMSKDDAGQYNLRILREWGASTFLDGDIMTLMDALFHAVTINGTSTAMPGRSEVRFKGGKFSMAIPATILGNDLRRWGRASADAIRDANVRTLNASQDEPLRWERREDLLRVAVQRGMQRHPTLCFDTADFCTGLTVTEQLAIAESKKLILANTTNFVDTAKAISKANTADGYVGTPGLNGHAAGNVASTAQSS